MIEQVRDPALNPLLAACGSMLAERLGLHFPPERWGDLQRGVAAAAEDLGCAGVRECLERLAAAPPSSAEIDVLAQHLTVGETYFRRDPVVFATLREHILPTLIRERRNGEADGRRIRAWSAACSTGEEAYSIAITLADLIPDLDRWNVAVLGTDLNRRSLGKAREGVYSEWSFRGAADLKTRCFSREDKGRYRIDPRFRSMVRFVPLNLADDAYPSPTTGTSGLDVIFCRNVLMYFHPERARAVVDRLARCLADGGWLVVSAVETSLVSHPDLQLQRLPGLILFRKRRVDVRPLPPIAASRPWRQETAAGRGEAASAHDPALMSEAALASGSALCSEGRYDEAVTVLEALAARAPGRGDVMRMLARAEANRGRLASARRWCERALAADRLDPAASFLRASILAELGELDAAVRAYEHTLYLDPHSALAHFALGNLRAAGGAGAEAQRHYRRAREVLCELPPEAVLPEAEGLPAGRLREMIEAILHTETAR